MRPLSGRQHFALTPIRMVSRLFQLHFLFMFKYAMSLHEDIVESIKLGIFGLIQIRECALNWFRVEQLHKYLFDICHLYNLGASYPKHVIPMCK